MSRHPAKSLVTPFTKRFLTIWGLAAALSLRVTGAAPLRWVSLAPSLTEIICDLGYSSNLVGRSTACDYPQEVAAISPVGDFGRPNWELLVRMKPDCVFVTDLERPAMLRLLTNFNIRVVRLPCESWSQLMEAAREISAAAGEPERGEAWCRSMMTRRNAIRARVEEYYRARLRPRVYVEIWHHPLTTAGAASFLHDVVTLAGGENVGQVFSERYPHVSSEWVAQQDPEVIVLAYMLKAAESEPTLRRRLGWENIRAIRRGAICSEIHPDLLLRPGPRCLDGAEQLAEWLMKHFPE